MSEILAYVIGGFGILATVVGTIWVIFKKGEASGQASAENEIDKQRRDSEAKANEANAKANTAADRSSDDDNRDWLRKHARRDAD